MLFFKQTKTRATHKTCISVCFFTEADLVDSGKCSLPKLLLHYHCLAVKLNVHRLATLPPNLLQLI